MMLPMQYYAEIIRLNYFLSQIEINDQKLMPNMNYMSLQLFKKHVHYDLSKYYFGNRIISNWNSFPDSVTIADSIGIIENSLDRFWSNQACLFDYKADLTGTGSRSQL